MGNKKRKNEVKVRVYYSEPGRSVVFGNVENFERCGSSSRTSGTPRMDSTQARSLTHTSTSTRFRREAF